MKPDHFRKKYHFLFQKEVEEDQKSLRKISKSLRKISTSLEEDQKELERKVDRHISYLEEGN